MKVFKALFITTIILCSIFASSFAAIDINNTKETPLIDGITDNLWYDSSAIELNSVVEQSNIKSDIKMLWNNNLLFFLIRIIDEDFNSRNYYIDLFFGDAYSMTPIEIPVPTGIGGISSIVYNGDISRVIKRGVSKTEYGYQIEISVDLPLLFDDFDMSAGSDFFFDYHLSYSNIDDNEKHENVLTLLNWNLGENYPDKCNLVEIIDGNNADTSDKNITMYILVGVSVLALIVLIVFLIIKNKKNKDKDE